MNKRMFVVALLLITGGIGVAAYFRLTQDGKRDVYEPTVARTPPTGTPESANSLVPAHYESAPRNLGPTLPPEKFSGKTRDAYKAAREIPQTLAQLPCYCHCDSGMGHKSLHSCYEDDHAAHCAVCVDEALMAYRLQKEQGLSAAQIRERIITDYSKK
jgi:Protein of unknown function with PCYCGC motif